MSAHSTHNAATTSHPPTTGGATVRVRVTGSELLRFAAVAVLLGNFVLGTYQRSPVHTVLIGGYLAVTLASLLVAVT